MNIMRAALHADQGVFRLYISIRIVRVRPSDGCSS